jgi:predicted metalloprotease with PDZ domain
MDSLEVLTRDILKAQIDFWGDFPCPRYYFLIYAPTFLRLPSLAQGALEHSNSSAYLLVNMPWNRVKSSFAHILSHEVFHLWNVKRIHSSLLGPFDYTKPVKTTSLWLSEGITDYYGHLLLSRYGILDESEFERQIVGWNYSMNHSTNSAAYSLEELSKMQSDFRLENATVFYFKGPLVGLLLDLEIRERTNNQRSLDDVMYALYKDAKIGRHFRDNDLFPTMERIAGVTMTDFYRKYIAGKDSLPVDEYLAKIGLIRNFRDTLRSGVSLGAKVYYSSIGRCIIDSVTDPELQNAGVMKGDTILTINNETVNREYINKILAKKMTPPLSAEVLIGTLSGRRTLKHTFTRSAETTISTKDIGRMPTADHRQIKLRQSLYGKRDVN